MADNGVRYELVSSVGLPWGAHEPVSSGHIQLPGNGVQIVKKENNKSKSRNQSLHLEHLVSGQGRAVGRDCLFISSCPDPK